jgi:2-oxoglutarate dehydrogenase E2 component (dihydrolipoamide succinyltransferase)
MSIEMKVPSVGESVTEVTIATWVKKDGDFVKMDEVICELESDKATFELPAEADGILRIIGKEGETLAIGSPICKIESSVSEPAVVSPVVEHIAEKTVSVIEPAPAVTKQILEIKVPAVGESITEVTVANWLKKSGDSVSLDEVICELESDKATFELPSPQAGILTIIAQPGSVVPIGGILASLQIGGSIEVVVSQPSIEIAAPVVTSIPDTSYASGHPSPAAAKVMAEKGLTAQDVQGTGVGGRITKDDAQTALPKSASQVASPSAPAAAPTLTIASDSRSSRREKMTTLRKTISKRLVAVKNETAMLTTFNEVDMKPIMDLRKAYKDKFKETHGVGLGFMSFFTKACSIALLEFPLVNAYIDGEEIVYNEFTDISIAVSAPRGLVVPVIRNSEKMSFAQIEAEVVRLATKARDNKLTIEEMTGGTFTITNGGIFGSMLSTPIINSPQSAILGMHNIVERPVAINGQVEIRPIMYVALSYDHRIIDGKDSVGFLVRVKQLLEDPMRMLLQV